MNRIEFLNALRSALSVLPDDERTNIMRYYEDYFFDAENITEEELIAQLGDPQKIANDILADYRELTVREQARDRARYAEDRAYAADERARRNSRYAYKKRPKQEENSEKQAYHNPYESKTNYRDIPDEELPRRSPLPWILLVVMLLIVSGMLSPLLAIIGAVILFLPLVLLVLAGALAAVCVAIPIACLGAGAVLFFTAFALLIRPAAAVLQFGLSLVFAAIGLLLGLLCIKLFTLFFPPLFRGLVAFLRRIFDRLRGVKK